MSSLHTVLYTSVLWLDFAGFTTLIGTLAFQYLIIRPVILSLRRFESVERRLLQVEVLALMLVALASIQELLLRALLMGGGIIGNVSGVLPSMLLETRYGTIWIARIGLLGLLGITWWLRVLGVTTSPRFIAASLFGASVVALTTTLSGHAADWGDVTLAVLIDWLHLLAVSTWLGGLLVLGFVLRAALLPAGTEDAARLFVLIARQFSRIASVCVTVFLVTGLLHPRLRLMSFSTLFQIPYGWTLSVKLSLVLLVLGLAALNRYYFLPRLGSNSTARTRLTVTTIGRLEWILAIGVLVCSALLTQLTPARHIPRYGHHKQHAVLLPPPVKSHRVLFLSLPDRVASVGRGKH
ncbi:CopD family protein [Candidatus Methylomirabilis sp.]|uniref:copper resistance D family protein n=1 Tax=Candidatus Methylomirabilis sp. TaxID=2032687 RepID=UPI0030768741